MVINFLLPHEPDQNMPYLSPYHQSVLNSATFHQKTSKFYGNGQIPRLGSKFCIHVWLVMRPSVGQLQ